MSTKSFLAQVGMQLISLVFAAVSFDFTIVSYTSSSGSTVHITVGEKYYVESLGVPTQLWDCDEQGYYVWKSECYSWKYLYVSVILFMIFIVLNILLIGMRKFLLSWIEPHIKKLNIAIKLSTILALGFGISGISYVCTSSYHYFTIQIHTVALLLFVQIPIVLGFILEFTAIQKELRLLDD